MHFFPTVLRLDAYIGFAKIIGRTSMSFRSDLPEFAYPMKCLSVRQPFASLIVTGRKTIETRRWLTRHRAIIGQS